MPITPISERIELARRDEGVIVERLAALDQALARTTDPTRQRALGKYGDQLRADLARQREHLARLIEVKALRPPPSPARRTPRRRVAAGAAAVAAMALTLLLVDQLTTPGQAPAHTLRVDDHVIRTIGFIDLPHDDERVRPEVFDLIAPLTTLTAGPRLDALRAITPQLPRDLNAAEIILTLRGENGYAHTEMLNTLLSGHVQPQTLHADDILRITGRTTGRNRLIYLAALKRFIAPPIEPTELVLLVEGTTGSDRVEAVQLLRPLIDKPFDHWVTDALTRNEPAEAREALTLALRR